MKFISFIALIFLQTTFAAAVDKTACFLSVSDQKNQNEICLQIKIVESPSGRYLFQVTSEKGLADDNNLRLQTLNIPDEDQGFVEQSGSHVFELSGLILRRGSYSGCSDYTEGYLQASFKFDEQRSFIANDEASEIKIRYTSTTDTCHSKMELQEVRYKFSHYENE